MISSSKLSLAADCPGAFTLPWRDSPSNYTTAGNERHAEDERAINAGDVPDVYDSRWPGLRWRAEVSYAYDVSTGVARELGVGLNRAYGELRPFEVPGTIDAEGRNHGLLVVVDRKGYEEQEPASRHRQLRFLALAAARARAVERIVVAIRPEVGAMDVVDVDPVFDLAVIAGQVKRLVLDTARVRAEARDGKPAPFSPGRHCRWCPAFDACPQQEELRALVRRDDEDPELALSMFVDDDSASDVHELWKRIGILHKRIGQQLYAHAASRPIRLRNGKLFGPHQKPGDREYDGAMVHTVAAETLGRDVADQVVEMVASQAKFERVVKPLVPRGKFAATKRAVFDEVDKRGGMRRPVVTTIEEYDPGLRLVADEPSTTTPPALPAPATNSTAPF